jgi:Zn-finger nucleic acid-binding protein
MESRTATPAGAKQAITADVCAHCGGLFLDGVELAVVSAALGALPGRLGELSASAAASELACPRCTGEMLAFQLAPAPIDLCKTCCGVWLDAGEYEQVTAGVAAPTKAAPKQVRCFKCSTLIDIAGSYYSDLGVVCGTCFEGEQDAMAGRGEKVRAAQAAYDAAYGPGTTYFARTHATEIVAAEAAADLSSMKRELDDLRRKLGRT